MIPSESQHQLKDLNKGKGAGDVLIAIAFLAYMRRQIKWQ